MRKEPRQKDKLFLSLPLGEGRGEGCGRHPPFGLWAPPALVESCAPAKLEQPVQPALLRMSHHKPDGIGLRLRGQQPHGYAAIEYLHGRGAGLESGFLPGAGGPLNRGLWFAELSRYSRRGLDRISAIRY
jgi:hypothetical protein